MGCCWPRRAGFRREVAARGKDEAGGGAGGTLRAMLMAVSRVLCNRAALPGVPQTVAAPRELPWSWLSSMS